MTTLILSWSDPPMGMQYSKDVAADPSGGNQQPRGTLKEQFISSLLYILRLSHLSNGNHA